MSPKRTSKPVQPSEEAARVERAARLLNAVKRAYSATNELLAYFPTQSIDDPETGLIAEASAALQRLGDLIRGSEPYWMADVRAGQKRIDAKRRAAHSRRPSDLV